MVIAPDVIAGLRVAPGQEAGLPRRDPAGRLGIADKRSDREERTAALDKLAGLHYRLWAEARRSVLLVLQGMDTAGKDGVIRRVVGGLNPPGCTVTAFKAPTTLQLE